MKRALVLALVLVPAVASAKPKLQRAALQTKTGDSYFLAADPHVPLAVVHRGVIKSAVGAEARGHACGKRSRWAAVGSTWRALDAWGQFAGTATVQFVDEYDVTKCAEVVFAPKFHRHSGRYVFVSADSAYQPAPSLRWQAPAAAHAGFEKLLDDALRGESQQRQSDRCTEIPERSRYFHVGDKKLAVGGGEGGYVIAAYGKSWSVESREVKPTATKGMSACYRPVSVFDLDGDGSPEIVMRYFEVDSWGDVVLARDPKSGKWSVVADSPGGSTA